MCDTERVKVVVQEWEFHSLELGDRAVFGQEAQMEGMARLGQ